MSDVVATPREELQRRFSGQYCFQWTICGDPYPMNRMTANPMFYLREGRLYRIRMKNVSDDIQPVHLHRHSFEVTWFADQPMSELVKDVVMVDGYQEVEIDFVANSESLNSQIKKQK